MKKLTLLSLLLVSNLAFSQVKQENVLFLNRIGYAPTTKSLGEINKLGYKEWINQQIDNPNKYSDKEILEKLKTLDIQKKSNFEIYKINDGYVTRNNFPEEGYPNGVLYQNLKKKYIYDIYSENRLREMMVWFWFNHFYVNGLSNQGSLSLLNDYINKIRDLSLTNFPELLKTTASHPAMLRFLNNTENVYPKAQIPEISNKEKRILEELAELKLLTNYGYNENYAREFLELHTMGVNSGYTQKDIENLAKILTGFGMADFYSINRFVELKELQKYNFKQFKEAYKKHYGVDVKDNLFVFNEKQHDFSDKKFLGKTIKGSGANELNEVIDIVSKSEKTAEFISRKMATYFLGEEFDNKVVLNLKDIYLKTNGEIRPMLKFLLNSNNFTESVKKQDKYKDVYSSYIYMYKVIIDNQDVQDFEFITDKLNEVSLGLFEKKTPEGYSLKGKEYIGSQILFKNLRFSKSIVFLRNDIFKKKININYDLISKIEPSIKNENSLYYYFASPFAARK